MRTRERNGQAGTGIVAFGAGAPVIEAEFVVLARSADVAPQPASAARAAPFPALPGLDALRPPPRQRPFSARGGAMFWTLGLWAAALSFWMAGGHALMVGEAAGDGALPPIETSPFRVEREGGSAVLLVEATVRNPGPAARTLLPVAIRVGTGDGESLTHLLSAGAEPIAPGARRRFRSRLPFPPGGVREAQAYFAQ